MQTSCVDEKCAPTCKPGLAPCDGGCCSVTAITVGPGTACARRSDGSVWCWSGGEDARFSEFTSTPSQVLFPKPAREIARVGDSVCILAGDGQILCQSARAAGLFSWGRAEAKYRHVYSGDNPTLCALDDVGAVDCTENFHSAGEIIVHLPGPWVSFSVGATHECGIHPDGSVACRGSDDPQDMSLVLQGSYATSSPITIQGLASPTRAVASGIYFSCALDATGRVQCWGRNGFGALGTGDDFIQLHASGQPLDVLGLSSGVAQLTASGQHACAITTDRNVLCWGSFYCPTPWSPVALTAEFSGPVSAIAPQTGLICAILLGGGVECFAPPDDPKPTERECTDHVAVYRVPGL